MTFEMSKNADPFGRRPPVFFCLESDDIRQEGVFPNSLCHISDEMDILQSALHFLRGSSEPKVGCASLLLVEVLKNLSDLEDEKKSSDFFAS
jgi:hypothetical protein